jgi:hypothetical protein
MKILHFVGIHWPFVVTVRQVMIDMRRFVRDSSPAYSAGIDMFWGRTNLTADKCIHLLPDAKLVVYIPPAKDWLVLHRFDLNEMLAKSNLDYLIVTSQPPPSVKRGETYTY